MREDQFLKKLGEALEVEPGNEELLLNTDLMSVPTWDSIGYLRVINMLEVDYRVLASADMIARCVKVEDLYNLIQKKSSGSI